MISSKVAKVVLSGTFRKNSDELKADYLELIDTNCQVLSPRSLAFDEGEFVRSWGEQGLPIRTLEDSHLASIKAADFIWLHNPDGYVGLSGAFEIGFAVALGVPVYARQLPTDTTIGEYVTVCTSIYAAKRQLLDQG